MAPIPRQGAANCVLSELSCLSTKRSFLSALDSGCEVTWGLSLLLSGGLSPGTVG